VDALGMALAVIELGKITGFAAYFIVADFGFWFHFDCFCWHETLLSKDFVRRSLRSFFTSESFAHRIRQS
jgi:hypothetical protein